MNGRQHSRSVALERRRPSHRSRRSRQERQPTSSLASLVEDAVEQTRDNERRSGSLAIMVHVRHEDVRTAPLPSIAHAEPAAVLPTDLRTDAMVPAPIPDPLANRPVVVADALLAKRPFRRHIEGSRPYIVLGEGVRMINAHPMALMVFWGGITNWVLGAILVGHHLAGALRFTILITLLTGWLLRCLLRTGKMAVALDSTRAMRVVLVDPATWAVLESRGRWSAGMRLLAYGASRILLVRRPERALIRAATPAHERLDRQPAERDQAQAIVPDSGCLN
jgi:hypothetical protein